jgi:hypothetical protein
VTADLDQLPEFQVVRLPGIRVLGEDAGAVFTFRDGALTRMTMYQEREDAPAALDASEG